MKFSREMETQFTVSPPVNDFLSDFFGNCMIQISFVGEYYLCLEFYWS